MIIYNCQMVSELTTGSFFAIEIIESYKFCCFLSISVPNFGFFGEKLTLWPGLTGNHDFIAKKEPVVSSETMEFKL